MKKAQASIEYIFSLIVFLLIVIGAFEMWFQTQGKITDLKERFELEAISKQIGSGFFLVSNIRENISLTIEPNAENIKYIQLTSNELFLYNEESLKNIFGIYSLNITPLQKSKIKKMVISYYGQNITVS
ncbi:MAG: hypothetical protein ACK4J0_02930 [Candidatus Anstonellaceae archaeon]